MHTQASVLAGLLLLLGPLTGCGAEGGDSAPGDATEEEFCAAYAGLFSNFGSLDPGDTEAGVRAFREWAAEMEQVGTPEDIPAEARDGFEVMVDSIQEIDPDATEEDLERLGRELSEGDQQSGEAFVTYATETCPEAMTGMLGDLEEQMGDLEDELGDLEGQLGDAPG